MSYTFRDTSYEKSESRSSQLGLIPQIRDPQSAFWSWPRIMRIARMVSARFVWFVPFVVNPHIINHTSTISHHFRGFRLSAIRDPESEFISVHPRFPPLRALGVLCG